MRYKTIKKIIVVTIIIMIVAIGILIKNVITEKNKEVLKTEEVNKELETVVDEKPEVIHYYPNYTTLYGFENEILLNLLNDNREIWKTHLPLSEKLFKEYEDEKVNKNEEIEIFAWSNLMDERIIFKFRELEEDEYGVYGYGEGESMYYVVYAFDVNEFIIEDITFVEKFKIKDKDGNYTEEAKFSLLEYDYFEQVLFPSFEKTIIKEMHNFDPLITRRNVGVSDKFIEKYGYDEDLIKFNTPLTRNAISTDVDYEKGIIDIRVTLDYEFKTMCYQYKFTLDEKGYLDDLELISSEEIKMKSPKKFRFIDEIIGYAIFKNSNWKSCPFSEKFLSKYNSKDSIFKNKNYIGFDSIGIKNGEYDKRIVKLFNKDGTDDIGILLFIWNDNNEVDDILTYIVPEDKMHLSYEEMYKLAFN